MRSALTEPPPPTIGPDGLPVGADGSLTPVICFSDYCGDGYGYYLEVLAPLLIVIVGALISGRWRELPWVAVAGLVASLMMSVIGGRMPIKTDQLPSLENLSTIYLLFLGTAAISRTAKRAVQALLDWIRSRAVA